MPKGVEIKSGYEIPILIYKYGRFLLIIQMAGDEIDGLCGSKHVFQVDLTRDT